MAGKIKYDSVKVGDVTPTVTIENVTRPDFVRYAGASGDFVPLHYDQTFVEAAGIPTVFAQGMLTAGCLSRCLTDYRRGGPGASLQGSLRPSGMARRHAHLPWKSDRQERKERGKGH